MRTFRTFATIGVALVVVCTCGCTKHYYFELTCVVRNAADGQPLADVTAVLNKYGNADQFEHGDQLGQPTDANGKLSHEFTAIPGAFDGGTPRWYLKLRKDGFQTENVDIKPAEAPEGFGSKNKSSLFVIVYLRPSAR